MKNEKKRTLRGSILFTVVSVMALLIIFLIGTLTLAAAANNRAHKSYSSSQASYTARSAIESFTEAMQKNEGIVAAVQNLSPTNSVIHPEVIIGDTESLGVVGYYDASGNFVRDHITVERINGADTYTLYATDDDGHAAIDTDPVEQVRITATVRVGKEEETVSAVIRKRASGQTENPDPPTVKGLQTAGDAAFTTTGGFYSGAVALGLEYDPASEYFHIQNGSILAGTTNYLNGNFEEAGSGLQFEVNSTDFETVILGSYLSENNFSFNVNYTAGSISSVRDVPYVYVDGLLGQKGNTMKYIGKQGSDNPVSPFNMYVGTLQLSQATVNADVYMMDEADGTIVNVEESGTVKYSYEKGKNYIGRNTGNSKLIKWSTDLITGSDFDSYGGNIYCNGDLDLSATTVNGDVRVAGNCDITGAVDVYINGDLIVGGDLYVENESKLHITGNVYCDGAVSGWGEPSDELLPGVVQIPNFEHVVETGCTDYLAFSLTTPMPDWSGYMGYFGENAGWNGPVYYRYSNIVRDDSGAIIEAESEVDATFTPLKPWDSKTAYDVVNWTQGALQDDGTVVDSGDPLDYPEDGEFSYYKNGVHITAAQAYSAAGVSPTSVIVASVYPTNMTREAIYGSYNDSGEFEEAPSATKIVTTLDEMQEAIGFDPEDGSFDITKYPTSLPSAQQNVWNDAAQKADCMWGGQSVISASATPQYTDKQLLIFDGSMNLGGKTIEITPVSGMYIVLDGTTNGSLNIGQNTNIIINEVPGVTVYFLIRGTVNIENSTITTRNVYNKTSGGTGGTLTEDDTVGIVYYADESTNPSLNFKNNDTVVGNALAPSLKLTGTTNGGKYSSISYKDSAGNVLGSSLNPHWIGNALVKSVEGFNNFTLMYTKPDTSGGGGGGGGGFETSLGYYELSYFSAA